MEELDFFDIFIIKKFLKEKLQDIEEESKKDIFSENIAYIKAIKRTLGKLD